MDAEETMMAHTNAEKEQMMKRLMTERIGGITFTETCEQCLGTKELVEQFNRLTGRHIGEKRTNLDMMIDDACGYDPDAKGMKELVDFVFEYVWIPTVKSILKGEMI